MGKVSLLDMQGCTATRWYVVYKDRENPRWWNTFLKPGFQHVEVWRPIRYGPQVSDIFWLVIDPGLEYLEAEVVFTPLPPWHTDTSLTVQYVVGLCRAKKVRDWFHVGPVTCVEMVKVCLGVKSFWLRTPWQLYRYIARRGGVLNARAKRWGF